MLWQAWGNTLFGCAAWGWLLAHHLAATALVLAGLAINVPWPRWRAAPA